MRRLAAVVLAGAAAAGAAWWAFSPGRGAPNPAAEEGSAEAPSREGQATLVGHPAPSRPTAEAGSASTLFGVVTREGIPCPARVEIRLVPGQSRFAGGPSADRLRAWLEFPAPAPPPLAIAVAGRDGRYQAAVSTAGYFEAYAIADRGETGYSNFQVVSLGTRVELNLAIRTGAFGLEGRVVHADGRPWVGRVTAASDTAPSRYLHRRDVTTDERGRFAIPGLPAGTATVTAFRTGELVVSRTGVAVPHDGPFELVIDDGLSTLTGTVVDDADGKPIGGAFLVANAWGPSGGFRAAATSAADGAFAIPWAGGRYDNLYVACDGYAGFYSSAREVRAPMAVRLAKSATVAGRVLRASDGTPVAGASVRALSLVQGTYTLALAASTADDEGRYQIAGLPPGDVAIVGAGPGLRSPISAQRNGTDWGSLTATLVSGARVEKDVRLVAAASVAGKAIDADGVPVAGATVRIGELGDSWAGGPDVSYRDTAQGTAADGAFLIDGLPPDTTCTLDATAPGRPPAKAGPVRLRAGDPVRVEIRFPAGERLEVIVVDQATGAPLAGATVRAQPAPSAAASNAAPVDAVTDATGRAKLLGLFAGPLTLEVRSSGRGTVLLLLNATAGSLTVPMGKGHVLAGKLLRPDGSPPARAYVNLRDVSTGAAGPARETEPDGTFRFEDLPDTSFEVRASAMSGDWLTAEETMKPAEGVVIRLRGDPSARTPSPRGEPAVRAAPSPTGRTTAPKEEKAALEVLVTDGDGKRVPSASAHLVSGRSRWGANVTAGSARFDRVPEAGDLAVEVWGARDRYGVPLPLGPARVPVPRDADVFTVTLPPELTVEGTVFAPDGRGAEGVIVLATTPAQVGNLRLNPYPYEAHGSTRTGADGRFKVGGLADEEAALLVKSPAGTAPVDPVKTRGGARGVEIRLRAGVTPRIVVVDPEGAPIPGADVTALAPGADSKTYDTMQRTTGADGVIQLEALDPTIAYRLRITPRNRGDLVPHVVERWTPKDETIVVPRAAAVKGIVVDTSGTPIAKAWVARVGDEPGKGLLAGTPTSADGRFELRGIPEGPVTVRASLSGTLATAETTVDAKPGASEVTLVLDLRTKLEIRVEGWADATQGKPGSAALFDGPPTKEARRTTVRVEADGTITVRGLSLDRTYTLWIAPWQRNFYVLATGIRLSAEPAVATLSRGADISGMLSGPLGTVAPQVTAIQGGLTVQGVVQANGRYVVPSLPPGEWRIVVSSTGDPSVRGEATAPAGGTADIELKPEAGR